MARYRAKFLTRLRLAPLAGDNVPVLATLSAGDNLPAEPAPGNPGWLRFLPAFGQAKPLGVSVKNPYGPYAYASLSLFDLIDDTPPPPAPLARPIAGVSVLNAHHVLEPAYAAGLRVFLIMNGLETARQFKARHSDAMVFYRKFMPHGNYFPDPDGGEMRELQTIGGGVILMTPCNENDIAPQNPSNGLSSDEVIGRRARFDAAMAANCRRYGTLYAGGGWSTGNPDHTDPAVCEALARHYAPHYNSGLMGMNCHLYSPTPGNYFFDDGREIWHENRYEFYFERCGFLNVPNAVGFVADECGLDEGGVGGVPAHGLAGDYVERWTRRAIEKWSTPIQGKPSPMRAGTWFQAGDNDTRPGQWGGYNVEPFLADIARAQR